LDGKTTSRVNIASNKRVNTNRNYSKPAKKTVKNLLQQVIRLAQFQQKTIVKPEPETVSFNPEIPVIQDYRHVVILGETTQSIAKKYDIPVETLKAANPGLGSTVVKGDRLRIPDKTKLDTAKQK